MKLENVKIIHTLLDIPITYNNNETNFENVLILDCDNKNINGITYTCPIYFDLNIINNNLLNKNNYNFENVFLFYSFMYQIAFGHFIEQCLPKINYYLNLKKEIKNLKFCIPKKRNNLLTRNIIKLLNISDDEIIILDHDTVICCKNFYYNNYECADFNSDKIEIFNLIREKLSVTKNLSFNRIDRYVEKI